MERETKVWNLHQKYYDEENLNSKYPNVQENYILNEKWW